MFFYYHWWKRKRRNFRLVPPPIKRNSEGKFWNIATNPEWYRISNTSIFEVKYFWISVPGILIEQFQYPPSSQYCLHLANTRNWSSETLVIYISLKLTRMERGGRELTWFNILHDDGRSNDVQFAAHTILIDRGSLGISRSFLQQRKERCFKLVNLLMLFGIVTILEPSILR